MSILEREEMTVNFDMEFTLAGKHVYTEANSFEHKYMTLNEVYELIYKLIDVWHEVFYVELDYDIHIFTAELGREKRCDVKIYTVAG